MSKCLGYKVVRDMRDALILSDGISYQAFCMLTGVNPSNIKTKRSWQKAEKMIGDQESWRKYILARIGNLEDELKDALDDYYNEGFGYEGLSQDMINILQRSGS